MNPRDEINRELEDVSPQLARLQAVNPYRVPAGYFDSFAAGVLKRIKRAGAATSQQEIEAISPLLAGLQKTMPYSVPDGYFDRLPAELAEGADRNDGAKVVRLPVGQVLRYAAAAVTVGLVALLGWLYTGNRKINNEVATNSAKVTAEEQVRSNINNISDSEIVYFIENGSLIYSLEPPVITAEVSNDMLLMLADVSDEELEKYIEQHNPGHEKFN